MGLVISTNMFIFFSVVILLIVTFLKLLNKNRQNVNVNYKEEFVKLVFVVYILMVAGVTLFPVSIGGYKQHVSINLHPFEQLIYQIKMMGIKAGDSKLFRMKLILKNFGGNFILLFPLGILAPIIFKKINTIFKVVLLGFLVSLFTELIQVVEVLINLSRWSRAFDVDDIILNTLGATVGYLMYRIFTLLLQKFKNINKEKDNAAI